MDWITIIWSMNAGICLILAVIYLSIWFHVRNILVNLAFSLWVFSVACWSMLELALMHSQTPEQYGEILRWMHIPMWTALVGYIWFVRSYLHAGRQWLMWIILGFSAVKLVVNFMIDPNVSFRKITDLKQISFLGELVAFPVGVPSTWEQIGLIIALLTPVFVVDSAVTAWRQSRHRRALVMVVAMLISSVGCIALAFIAMKGYLSLPIVVSLPSYVVILLVAYELGENLQRTAKVSHKLIQAEKRIELAVNAADLSIWEWDIAKDEIWTTAVGRTLIGVAESERINIGCFLQVVHPDDREEIRKAIERSIKETVNLEVEYRLIASDGHTHWIATYGQPERDVNGKPRLIRGVSVDITERKKDEREKLELRTELEHLNRVMTMNELTSSLAHEINQPLGAILNYSNAAKRFLSQDKPDLSKVREAISGIILDSRRAANVLQRIRELMTKDVPRYHPIQINTVLQEVLDFIRGDSVLKAFSIQADLAPGLPSIAGDKVRLQQVLLNLMLNASNAMNTATSNLRKIVIKTESDKDRGVMVSVRDFGTGIDEAQMDRLFEPFYTNKPGRMGLGLAISARIIHDHEGSIWAENNADGGATFYFTLPKPTENTGSNGA